MPVVHERKYLPLDQRNMETLEIINLYKFIQVHAETFTSDAQMVSKIEMIRHLHIMMSIFRILILYCLISVSFCNSFIKEKLTHLIKSLRIFTSVLA